jgi:hypothetical protein
MLGATWSHNLLIVWKIVMRVKLTIIFLVLIFCVIVIEVYYLKTLPCSFVNIYYTSEPKDFNKAPTSAMVIEIDGYSFSYYIPNKLEKNSLRLLNDQIEQRDSDGINRVIIIANWTRGKLKFGKPNGNRALVVEHIVNHSTNEDFNVLCDSYARLFVIACQSLEIPARIIELNGHVVSEVFIKNMNKWVMIDPIYGYYMSKDNELLSAAEIIEYYKNDVRITPIVFAEGIGDDCLYEEKHEATLKTIYLNGFTVVSDQSLDRNKIKSTIFKSLQLPIAKLQFVDENSALIGSVEKKLRYSILITTLIFILVSIIAFKKSV